MVTVIICLSESVKVYDLLGLGAVAVDDLIYVPRYPPPDAKISVLRSERQCGGLTGTALVAAARLGSKCVYAGVLGQDEFSQFAVRRLQEEGIDLGYLQQRAAARPVHSFIVVDEQRQTRNVFADSTAAIGAADDWPSREVIHSTRVLFVDHFGLKGMMRAARLARELNIPVVADFEREDEPLFPELLQAVDHLILSHGFVDRLTGEAEPARAIEQLWNSHRQAVVITCGQDGCWYRGLNGPIIHHPAYPVKTVDTTGCGDVFHGAYASALARGLELEARIEFSSAAAALKARQRGGQTGIPDRRAVESFLQSSKS